MPKNYGILFLLVIFLTGIAMADEWKSITPSGTVPSARSGHTMVEINGKVYLFGGQEAGRVETNNTSKYDVNIGAWEVEAPTTNLPPARKNHSAVAYNGKMYVLYGQGTSVPLNDVWAYTPDTKTWQQLTVLGERPSARAGQSVVCVQDKLYLFGGKDRLGNVMSDMWSLDPSTSTVTWTKESEYMNQSYGHGAAVVDSKIYIYGGNSGMQTLYDYLLVYDVSTKMWDKPTISGDAPAARYFPVMANDNGSLLVYGGTGTSEDLGDTWKFDIGENKWTRLTDGPILTQTAAVVLPDRAGMSDLFLFGGLRNGVAVQENWQYVPDSTPPTPTKALINQIGVLGKGQFSLYVMKFEEDQAKVKVDLSWTQDNAKLKLCALRIPKLFQHTHPLHMVREDAWENIGLQHLEHFQEMRADVENVRGTQTLSVTFANVKKGYLVLLARHVFCSKTARDIQLQISEMTDMPRRVQYVFCLGDPDKSGVERVFSVKLPQQPVRWHSHYPPFTQGKENTESGTNFWKWSYADKTRHFFWFPACVKFDLP